MIRPAARARAFCLVMVAVPAITGACDSEQDGASDDSEAQAGSGDDAGGSSGAGTSTGGRTGGTSGAGGTAASGRAGNDDGGAGGECGIGGDSPGGDAGDPGTGGASGAGGSHAAGTSGTNAGAGGAVAGAGFAGTGGSSGAGAVAGSVNGGAAGLGGASAGAGLGGAGGQAGSSSGGSSGGAGSGGLGGAGGGGSCTPNPMPPLGTEPSASLACSGWAPVGSFPQGLDLSGGIWGSSANDVYVAVGTFATGHIVHWNGTNWSYETLPESYTAVRAITGSSASNVWAAAQRSSRGVILHRGASGTWTEEKVFTSLTEPDAVSIWAADATNVFAVVPRCMVSDCKVQVYRRTTSGWEPMAVPAQASSMHGRRIWGTSARDIYVAGYGSKGFLWRFDGCVWNDVATIPDDVAQVMDVGSAGGELVAVGISVRPDPNRPPGTGLLYGGVRLVTTNLVNWSRNDSVYGDAFESADVAIWVPRRGAALVAGQWRNPGLNPPWGGYLALRSQGAWSEATGGSADPSGIWAVPNSNRVMVAGYGEVIAGTCM